MENNCFVESLFERKWQTMIATIYPEVVAAAFAHPGRLGGEYMVWTVMRAIDSYRKERANSGCIPAWQALAVIRWVLGTSEKHAYEILHKGAGIFWSLPTARKTSKTTRFNRIGLFGINKVVYNLAPTLPRTEPFVFRLGQILPESERKQWSDIRSFLISLVAARHTTGTPLSQKALAVSLGVSLSTARRGIYDCEHLIRISNYAIRGSYLSEHEAAYKLQSLRLNGGGKFHIEKQHNSFVVLERLPNRYILPEFERKSVKSRPKSLKARDEVALQTCAPRHYIVDAKKQSDAKRLIYYTPLKNKGYKSMLWSCHEAFPDLIKSINYVQRWHMQKQIWAEEARQLNKEV